MHHIIADGWSLNILLREIGATYDELRGGPAANLTQVSHQYREYVEWQASQPGQPRAQADLEYWRRQLQGIEAIDLPCDRPRPRAKSYRGRTDRFALSDSLSMAMEGGCRSPGIRTTLLVGPTE